MPTYLFSYYFLNAYHFLLVRFLSTCWLLVHCGIKKPEDGETSRKSSISCKQLQNSLKNQTSIDNGTKSPTRVPFLPVLLALLPPRIVFPLVISIHMHYITYSIIFRFISVSYFHFFFFDHHTFVSLYANVKFYYSLVEALYEFCIT